MTGVEEAFYLTKKVVTLSFHKQSPGFFPGMSFMSPVFVFSFVFLFLVICSINFNQFCRVRQNTSVGSGRGKNYNILIDLFYSLFSFLYIFYSIIFYYILF